MIEPILYYRVVIFVLEKVVIVHKKIFLFPFPHIALITLIASQMTLLGFSVIPLFSLTHNKSVQFQFHAKDPPPKS